MFFPMLIYIELCIMIISIEPVSQISRESMSSILWYSVISHGIVVQITSR
jgi:hypothetical protein